MKKIDLKYGLCALVDDEDFEELNKYKWHLTINKSGNAYAKTNIRINGKYVCYGLHQIIMEDTWIDHIDNDGLNNQKCNLRKSTPKQNAANKPIRNKTGYKGIKLLKNGQYRVFINSKIKVGVFNCLEDAIVAYNIAALQEYGIFAVLNTYKPSTYTTTGKYEDFKNRTDNKNDVKEYSPSSFRLFVEQHGKNGCGKCGTNHNRVQKQKLRL